MTKTNNVFKMMSAYVKIENRIAKASFVYGNPEAILMAKESLNENVAKAKALAADIKQQTGHSPEYWEKKREIKYPNYSWYTLGKLFSF